jgi:hypothetical protein
MAKRNQQPKQIRGQVQYLGPQVPQLGLSYSTLFLDGIYPHLYETIAQCPALGELFIPIARVAVVRRELNFDIARNMRGTEGRYVAFYREVQRWVRTQTQMKEKKQPITIIEENHHA